MKKFLDYVEIRTKITSVFPFLMCLGFLLYQKIPIRWGLTGIFFASMLLFDLTTTAINNFIDARSDDHALPYARGAARAIMIMLFSISAVLGISLALLTDYVVLLLGGLCFLGGVLYTAGPIPLSRLPLGEIASGFFYGLLIPLLMLYINMPFGSLILIEYSPDKIGIALNIRPMLSLLLLSVAPACTTANIMLANNICDLKKDILVRRHTLPYYLGKNALRLFAGLYYVPYAAVTAMVAFGFLPPLCLAFLLTMVPVTRNIRRFLATQDKETTFGVSIQNYVIMMGSFTGLLLLGGIL